MVNKKTTKQKTVYEIIVTYKGYSWDLDCAIRRRVGLRNFSGSGITYTGIRDLTFCFGTKKGRDNALKRLRAARLVRQQKGFPSISIETDDREA